MNDFVFLACANTQVYNGCKYNKNVYIVQSLRAFSLAELRGLPGRLGLAEGSLGETRTSWNGNRGVPELPWRSPVGPWEVVVCPWDPPARSRWVPEESLGVPREARGLLGEGPGGTDNTKGFLTVFGGGFCGPLG